MLANTQIIEQTGEGEDDDQRPAVQVEDMELNQGTEEQVEEQKDNEDQIEEQKNQHAADLSMREDNTTPFMISDKAQGALDGIKTGLVKDSYKAKDLNNPQIDFGTQGDPENSLMDNSMNDTTQLITSPQKQPLDISRNAISATANATHLI